jgi:DNA-directed RNA polymerase sigma subunit (sigma70/sigma32)
MPVDLDRISALLKEHLSPLQEKVVRLYFGLGCSKSFSATEIALEFQVSRQMISSIVGGAQTRLERVGLTPSALREAARLQAKTWRHPCEAAKSRSAVNRRVVGSNPT